MEVLHDGYPSVSFVVDMTRCRDALLLFADLNGAESSTKLQLIVFAF